jgi:hypothetical protein
LTAYGRPTYFPAPRAIARETERLRAAGHFVNSLADTLWTLVRWAVPVTVAAVIAAGAVGAGRIDDQVRSRVQKRLAEEFPALQVQVQGASLADGEGIVIRGVSLVDPRLPQQWRQLVWIDEIRLACGTSLAELAAGPPQITAVRVRRPVVHVARNAEGPWTIAALLERRAAGAIVPIVIEDATVLIDDARRQSRTTLRQIALDVQPATADGATWATVRGAASADFFDRASFEGRVAVVGGAFELAGTLESLEVSPRLVAALPTAEPLPAQVRKAIEGVRGRVALGWRVSGPAADLDRLSFAVQGRLDSGRFEHPALPFAVSDVSATFTADRSGLHVQSLQGHTGSTLLRGSGRLHGWTAGGDLEAVFEAERLIVARHWEDLLPEAAAAWWRKLLPAGEVDVRAQFTRRSGVLDPRVSVRCRNVSLTHYRFPYRLDRTVGTAVLEGRSLSLHLTGQAGGHPVGVTGGFTFAPEGATGHVEVRGDGMRIDDALLAAMPPRSAEIVRTLRAAGTFDFVFRHDRGPTVAGGHANTLGIRLVQGSMSYAGFPYPLTNVSGNIRMDRGHWTFHDLVGANDTGLVRCSGGLVPGADGDGTLTLHLSGAGVVLERELRDALPPGMRRIWDDLDPRGNAEFTATVRHHVKARKTEVELEATPHGRTVSIEPAWFPYRLEQLEGKLVWKDGVMRFDGVRGMHARTTVAAEGTCRFTPAGGWHVSFAQLSADRFRADHDVVQALPAGVQRAIAAIRPRGLMSLSGALDIYSTTPAPAAAASPGGPAGAPPPPAAATPPPAAAWDLVIDMEQGSVDVGIPLEHVHGGVRLRGSSDGRTWQAFGDVAVDSAMWRTVQLTKITGPLAMDASGVRFGMVAGDTENPRPRRVEARVAGGTLAVDGRVTADEAGAFSIAAALNDADLQRLAGAALPAADGGQRFKGRLTGSVELSGLRAGTHSLLGRGQVRLRDAAIYELPLVVALLKVLRVKAPDRNAFGSSLVDFRIEGPHAYLDTIELSGDAISLVGAGEVDFDSNVRLVFRSIMGDAEEQLPVMKRVLGGASGQFMLIHVDGTLAQPELSTEAFPTLAAALQRLQAQQRGPDGLREARRERREQSR